MYFIKYFAILVLFAIQLSVQKSIPAEDTTFDELGSEGTQESAEVIAFNGLGNKIPQEPAKVIAFNEIGDEIPQDSVEEPIKKPKKDSKVKKVLKTASHFLKGALKTGVSAAGHGLLENILGGSSKNKKSKNGNGLFKGLFGSNKSNSESDESSEEKSKNKKKGENKSDSDENETSSKKKSSGGFVKSFKNKVAGSAKDGIKKKLTSKLFGKLF
ncbi:Hypothetical protein SRAE_X000191800 [Strongyloides ratti]|uniref:Uncharacterized protein n=1 Tax=Strongyloides ratti TaxID=34506 RepID=A0A090KYB9_STRRB|nr:Hypothetical protein SRAE_X000191800 [Strongyloides ratti]CEF60178.1 Hypothetical protein SRAE_X000191800 [Strongyloides ratti]